MTHQECVLESSELARVAFDAMSERQAEDLVILDIRPVSTMTDYFVIGTADNPRQMKAVINAIVDEVRGDLDRKPRQMEGEVDSGWVLVDYGDVVAHVFDADRRTFYALEELWDEAPLVARMQ